MVNQICADEWDRIDWEKGEETEVAKQVTELVLKGVNINAKRKGYRSPALMCAIYNGQEKAARVLLHYGADVNMRNYDNETALSCAAQRGRASLIEPLIHAGADINHTSYTGGSTPIEWAIIKGGNETFDELLRFGAKVRPEKALPLAAGYNRRDILRKLISSGLDVNVRDDDDNTPLVCAAKRGHAGVVEDLIVAGANIYVKDSNGDTALSHAASKGYVETAKLLEVADKNNLTPEQKIERIRSLTAKPYAKERRELAKKLTDLRKEFGLGARACASKSRIVQELRKRIYTR